MSKYTARISLDENSVSGLILRRIHRESTVLELGCAAGRMTRYLSRELGCRVCVIEKNREDFDEAMRYAEEGICADLQEYSWCEYLVGREFDYILLTDVLEHLEDPGGVLKAACRYLKEAGSMLVSVPNAAHNDILIKLFHDRVDYTPTGLLDDTHVHFWGQANLEPFFGGLGLAISEVMTTSVPTGQTEQFGGEGLILTRYEQNLLHERRFGTVYQFVLLLRKEREGGTVPSVFTDTAARLPSLPARIYLARKGRGFAPEDYLEERAFLAGRGAYRLHAALSVPADAEAVSIDPLDGQETIWRDIRLSQGGTDIAAMHGGRYICSGKPVYASSGVPQIFVPLADRLHPLMIDMVGIVSSEPFYRYLRDMLEEKDRRIRELENGKDDNTAPCQQNIPVV